MAMRIIHMNNFDVVISLGGGSTIDMGKAANALAANPVTHSTISKLFVAERFSRHPRFLL